MVWMRWSLPLGSAIILVACGASRASRPTCSKTNAITDTKTGGQVALEGERYDPSAAILLFKASTGKISIESRCNARLVHTLNPVHRLASGNTALLRAPIDFTKLDFQLENNSNSMELQTSAHCFYRIWDPRVPSQVATNPSLGQEPSKTLLTDPLNRYSLYKSLLTTPQKLVVFGRDNIPVEFEYKLSSQDIYNIFFQKIEAQNSDPVRKIVGREFSKTSILLDELSLDVCRSDSSIMTQIDKKKNPAKLSDVTDLISLKSFADGDSTVRDFFRRRLVTEGRNKLCFSQTDFIVAPIQFTRTLDPAQIAHLNLIHSEQEKKVNELEKAITENRYFLEFNDSSPPASMAPEVPTCPWMPTYPGLSVSHPFHYGLSSYMPSWQLTPSKFANVPAMLKKVLPNFNVVQLVQPPLDQLAFSYFNTLLEKNSCSFRGFDFDDLTQKCLDGSSGQPVERDIALGACPPAGAANSSEATDIHMNVNASLRLAFASSLLSLEKYREIHKESLLLPIAQLRDITQGEIFNSSSSTDKVQIKKIKLSLDEMNADHGRYTEAFDILSVEKVDEELQLICTLKNSSSLAGTGGGANAEVERVFSNLSEKAKVLVSAGFSQKHYTGYKNLAARYLKARCVNAGSQLLYSGFRQAPGLLQNVQWAEATFVTSDVLPSNGQIQLSNKEIIETGRPVSLNFLDLMLGRQNTLHTDGTRKTPQELNAQLVGTGHMQLGFCYAQGEGVGAFCDIQLAHLGYLDAMKRKNPSDFLAGARLASLDPDALSAEKKAERQIPLTKDFASALPGLYAHLNFLTAVPNWLPESEKPKYGAPTFPGEGFSQESARYFLSSGDSGTTISLFGLFPIFMLSSVQDVPVSGGLAVIPSTGGQVVQPNKTATCR